MTNTKTIVTAVLMSALVVPLARAEDGFPLQDVDGICSQWAERNKEHFQIMKNSCIDDVQTSYFIARSYWRPLLTTEKETCVKYAEGATNDQKTPRLFYAFLRNCTETLALKAEASGRIQRKFQY